MKKTSDLRRWIADAHRGIGIGRGLLLAAAGMGTLGAHAAEAFWFTDQQQTVVRNSTFEYDPTTGLLKKKIDQPDGPASQKLTTALTYDRGNPSSESRTGWAGAQGEVTRTTGATWSTDGRFPTQRTNALPQPEKLEFDPAFGGMTLRVDPNGWVTRWEYDGLGRKLFERRGYANETAQTYSDYTQWTYEACSSGCAIDGGVTVKLIVTATVKSSANVQIAPTVKTYLDELNREVRVETETLGASGQVATAYKDTRYDRRGNVAKVSQPYFSDASPKWTSTDFDNLGRKTTETAPNDSITTITYQGLDTFTKITVRGETRVRKSTADNLGRAVQTADARSNLTGFIYDATGALARVIGPYGDVVSIGYDVLGRKTSQSDPDLGDWTYGYNAFGELVSQTNGLKKTTSITYDALGRMVKRADSDLTSSFEYDTAANGLGLLAKTYSDNGYCREHGYDGQSRPTTTIMKVGSTACGNGTEALSASVGYDAYGRLQTETFPTGFTVTHGRHATLGIPTRITSDQLGGATLWTRDGGDAAGRATAFSYGNGVATRVGYDAAGMGWIESIAAGPGNGVQYSVYKRDEIGQLKSRDDSFDAPQGLSEWIDTDQLGRVKGYYRKALVDQTEVAGSRVAVVYDAVGRIVSKTDVGTYYYAQPGGKRPHAVTNVRGAVNVDYEYDDAGQMKVRNFADYLYTDAGYLRMAGGARKCHEFLYQGEGMRVQQLIFDWNCRQTSGQPQNGSDPSARTLYLHPDASNGLSFERETRRGQATQYKHYVVADGRPVAEVVSAVGAVANGTPLTVNYLHYDHLGSIVAVTRNGGVVAERRSFDPWGRVRETTGTPTANGDLPGGGNAATDRGFTLHEHLEGLDLIHMNGRAYDPLLARFTSGDKVVAEPYDGQSYDRYAYVLNQPLSATDPTGLVPVGYEFAFQLQAAGGSATGVSVGTAISLPWGNVPTTTAGGNGQTVAPVAGANGTVYGLAMELSGIKVSTFGVQWLGKGTLDKPRDKLVEKLDAFSEATTGAFQGSADSVRDFNRRNENNALLFPPLLIGYPVEAFLRDQARIASGNVTQTDVVFAMMPVVLRVEAQATVRGAEAVVSTRTSTPLLAAPAALHDHHLMPRQFKSFFSARGIDIDMHTVTLGNISHQKGIHGLGLGNMPGRWNQQWGEWIGKNPNATAKDIYQQLGSMMDRFNLNGLPIHPYGK
ncbi:RHS repeat-associated core domain-containing protein [Mitsuaria sp. 7]|uniref:RHS repeat-associated core domain-containing protein n=1 Tax=Mitsuaria sp. 7 TaxID=1658665 RepID=UPI0007DE24BD|nr:RHS repeat-associated core domain-containing protein [Mitsuaria sp. 7]ANH69755.1 hypothetical protein ABE85_23150 [Mitsuaria sp. 7]